jgi:hypothetical protein
MISANAGRSRQSLLTFVIVAAAIYAAGVAIVQQLPRIDHRGAVAVGVTFDLVVVVPLAFYLLVVRRLGLSIVTLAPVIVLSLIAASRVLPADHRQSLRALELLLAPLELGLLGWIGWRAARALRAARREAAVEPLEQFRRAAFAVTRNGRAAAIAAFEIAVLYYGLAAWRARPHAPAGADAFTHHVRSGHSGIVLAFLLVLAAEGFAVHLLLMHWNPTVAWIFTIGTVYGALWLIADYRATVLRPILVGPDGIVFRAGLRTTAQVPLASIATVGREAPGAGERSLKLGLAGTPTRWVTLTEPVQARGPYGLVRRVRVIGLEPDAPEEFDRVLAARLALGG